MVTSPRNGEDPSGKSLAAGFVQYCLDSSLLLVLILVVFLFIFSRIAVAGSSYITEWGNLVFSGFSVLIFFAQLIVFVVQARVFWIQAERLKESISKMGIIADGQTADMAKSIAESARAATAMETSAAQTEATLKTIRENAATELRAYVFGTSFETGTNIESEESRKVLEYIFWVKVENSGNSQANNVIAWLREDKTAASNQNIPDIPTPENLLPAVLGPRCNLQTNFVVVPVHTMSLIWEKKIRFFMKFRVEYADIFNSGAVHHHQAFFEIQLIHDPKIAPPVGHPPYARWVVVNKENTAS